MLIWHSWHTTLGEITNHSSQNLVQEYDHHVLSMGHGPSYGFAAIFSCGRPVASIADSTSGPQRQ